MEHAPERVTTDKRWDKNGAATSMAFLVLLVALLAGSSNPLSAQGKSFTPAVLAANDCTVTVNAGESISSAIDAAPTGAVVCVHEGVYYERLRLDATDNGKTLKAFPGEHPVIDGQGILPGLRYAGLVHVVSARDITIDGFEVRNSSDRGIVVGTPEGASAATANITLRNMVVHHSDDGGVIVKGNTLLASTNIVIEDSIIYQNLQKNLPSDNGGAALSFVQTVDGVARGNIVYNNHGEGIVSDRYATNILIENNVAYDNDHASIYVNNTIGPRVDGNFVFCTDDRTFWNGEDRSGPLKAGVGLQIRDEYFPTYTVQPPLSSGQIIVNNIVTGCSTNFGVATQVVGGGLTNAIVANNSFINARGDTGNGVNNVRLEGRATYQNSQFVNNLMLQTTAGDNVRLMLSLGTPDLSTFTVANNLYWPSTPSSSWYPNEPGRLVADPLLLNPALPQLSNLPDPAWYGLTANSPAINAGRDVAQVVDDFFHQLRSTPPDIGAIEFVSTANPGHILVTAETIPAGAAPLFSFTATFPPTDFQLSAGQSHDSGPIDEGTYAVTMSPFPGWTLTGATCSDGSDPAIIALAAGETVTCTFTNTQQPQTGTIIISKQTDPDGASDLFTFNTSYSADFQLADGQSNTSAPLSPGVYSVAENAYAGWQLTDVTCNDGSQPEAIDLAAGETVTCTFTNTQQPQPGTIIVRKETAPDGASDQFTFSTSYSDQFQLADGQESTSAALVAGVYSVEESVPAGWEQTSATCDDGSEPAGIDLAAGETVTCTFVNARRQQPTGTIIVLKETDPNGASDLFTFSSSYSAAFQLADGQSNTSDPLVAGTYSVQEAELDGWTLSNATCDDDSSPSAIDLAAGETVTCTFFNTQEPQTGMIIVAKETDPDGATQAFTFNTNYSASFQLVDGQSNTSAPLTAGIYSVQEPSLAGWTLVSATCDDGSSPSAIDLAAGETVTCTFNNREEPRAGTSEILYVSSKRNGSVGGISYGISDVIAYDVDTGVWSLFLKLSKVGIIRNLNGFSFMEDGSVLLTLDRNQSVNGLGTVTPKDVIRFIPTATGANTAGTFQWYLDGSDVSLTSSGEAIDTLALAPDGRLLISTTSTATVKDKNGANLKARDEDLIIFSPTSLGANSAGYWSLYFDGSTVKGLGVEDVIGAGLDTVNGDLYLTVSNNFNVDGVKGNAKDIIRLRPVGPGYQVTKYWSGPDHGYTGIPSAFEFLHR